mmetsp:Transcript_7897/g.23422  ORF Transcript_7897/g.23422 Transcript_7897/m.23422 type:complete len:211 (+) Transcript_7897:1014-1646(+)
MAPSSASPPKRRGAWTKTRVFVQSARHSLASFACFLTAKGPAFRSSLSFFSVDLTVSSSCRRSSLVGRGMSMARSNSIIALTPWSMSCSGPIDVRPEPGADADDLGGPQDSGGIPVSSSAFSSMPQLTGVPSLSLSWYGHTWEDRGSRRWIWHLPMTSSKPRVSTPLQYSTWTKRSGDWVFSRIFPSCSLSPSVSIEGSIEDSFCAMPLI